MKKKQAANIVMVVIILLIAAAGVLGVGYIRGWFDKAENAAVLADIRGTVNLQREGVAYPAEGETVLRAGDAISCNPGATAVIYVGDTSMTIGEKASLEVTDPSDSAFQAQVTAGEVFVNAEKPVTLSFDGKEVSFSEAAAALSVRAGAQSISVFAGTVGETEAGKMLDWVGEEQSVIELSIQSLNDFTIGQLRAANETKTMCFTNADLDALEAERLAAKQELVMNVSEDGTAYDHYCTIAIYCSTILDNWDNLDPAKAEFVPDDGVILAAVTAGFSEGETVFNVLERVCTAYDIQLEYSWTPLYNSYYIEGINHLYEFDCGAESGWMYKVNGWLPNYGCSAYTLTGGESIVWCYTRNGLGLDVGAPRGE